MYTPPPPAPFSPATADRPDPLLLRYYLIVSLLTVFGFPFVFLGLYCKYISLRYRFDDKGISMSWGVLFKREVYLTYRRIQDIHVTRNIIHRWLGLADVAVQTASGSAGAEMVIQGLTDPEGLRDFLYSQMRGARDPEAAAHDEQTRSAAEAHAPGAAADQQALSLLAEIRDELRRLRQGNPLPATGPRPSPGPSPGAEGRRP
jgi:putative membrane protein